MDERLSTASLLVAGLSPAPNKYLYGLQMDVWYVRKTTNDAEFVPRVDQLLFLNKKSSYLYALFAENISENIDNVFIYLYIYILFPAVISHCIHKSNDIFLKWWLMNVFMKLKDIFHTTHLTHTVTHLISGINIELLIRNNLDLSEV